MAYLFLALIALFFLYWFSQRRKKRALESFAQKELLPDLTSPVDRKRQKRKVILIFMAFISGILALMGPQMGFYWEEGKRKGLEILFAVDTSKSMLAEDIKPNRLEAAKQTVETLVKGLKGDRVGLIAFSGEAFLVCPLTTDDTIFMQSLGELDVKTLHAGGTSLSSPIQEALKSCRGGAGGKVLLLLSDGEDLEGDPVSIAESARKEGLKIFCVGIGTRKGELIPAADKDNPKGFLKDAQGNVVRSRLNREILEKIASITGGSYVHVDGGEPGLKWIHEKLSDLEKGEFQGPLKKRKNEWFQIPLALSLLFLLLERFVGVGKRRLGSGLAFLLSLSLLMSCGSDALQEPQRLLTEGKKDEARKSYETLLARRPGSEIGNYNLGVLLYQKGDYSGAIDHFVRVLLTEERDLERRAIYNLGNSKYRLAGQTATKDPQGAADLYRDALACYQRAIELDEKDEDAKVNQRLTESQLGQLRDLLSKQKVKGHGTRESAEKQVKPQSTMPIPSAPEPGPKETGSQETGGATSMIDAKGARSGRATQAIGGDRVEMTREEAEALLERYRSTDPVFVPSKLRPRGGDSSPSEVSGKRQGKRRSPLSKSSLSAFSPPAALLSPSGVAPS